VSDQVLVKAFRVACERLLADELKERAKTLRLAKVTAGTDPAN
jgi:hypothetical protein